MPKNYDDEYLNEQQLAGVAAARERWQKAYEAGDQAGMDQAHADAEAYRSQAGYSGGTDGSQYLPFEQQTPGAIRPKTTERFSYADAPQFVDHYDSYIQKALQQLQGRGAFSYDPEADPIYQQLREEYTRGGEKAMGDTMARMSQRTGGLSSSFAGTAAQQTYDSYMAALADKIPELREAARQMWIDEGNQIRADIGLYSGLQDAAFSRFLQGQLNPYYQDRGFAYDQFRDQIADQRYEDQVGYDRGRDALADQRYEDEIAYQRGQDQKSWDWKEKLYGDERDDVAFERAMAAAALAAQAGDYSHYKEIFPQMTDQQIKALADQFIYDQNFARQMNNYSLQQASRQAAGWASSGSPRSSSGSSISSDVGTVPSNGDSDDSPTLAQDAIAWANQYGGDPTDYVKANYKSYGYSSQTAALSALSMYGAENGLGDTESKSYGTVLAVAKGYSDSDDAKSYLERMVDGNYISADEAAYIWQVELGGDAQAQVQATVPTTYKEFATLTGYGGILTENEFSRRKGSKGYVAADGVKCKTYQDYLNLMWKKYKK